MKKLKINAEKLLPIALAVFLPGLNLFSNSALQEEYELDFYKKWFYATLVLYPLWLVLEWVSKMKFKYKFLLIILSIILFTAIIYFLLALFEEWIAIRWVFIIKFFSASMLFLVIQYALQTQKNVTQLKIEKEQMQTENYRAQLESLRAKVDPHFLFNSLNTLRTMVRHNDAKSEQFILSLSDFYRQTLKYNEAKVIKLLDEIKLLESYLFLMKNRNGEAISITIDIQKELYKMHIPTLAMQTVVENCFKHNMMTSKAPLKIEIINTADDAIEVINNIQPKLVKQPTSGYGLEFLKKRYELLGIYDGVEIDQTEEEFTTRLKLI
ncbi:sensor histidine kinase [Chryseobacterium sp. SC28]|uniref:sensor histidine kinase n=1 Tax=Chryseobacterium sp. SC28 TaxID=2268028 RepID=UPI000F64FBA1|nr:histidine kinase [Chryseobacterium sp. SC28]RRQ46845.1 hypothetical protein DTW91_03295 [Chryseobacterium sp. SC28]